MFPFIVAAQFQERNYSCVNEVGVTEYLRIQPKSESGEVTYTVYYTASQQSKETQLQVKANGNNYALYWVRFPNENNWYQIESKESEIRCTDATGKTQVFLEQVPENAFATYVFQESNKPTEKLFIYSKFAVGNWHIIEYQAANTKRIRLEILKNGVRECTVKFPNQPQTYLLSYEETDIYVEKIKCRNPDGTTQIFKVSK
jgi:hypothetical protein